MKEDERRCAAMIIARWRKKLFCFFSLSSFLLALQQLAVESSLEPLDPAIKTLLRAQQQHGKKQQQQQQQELLSEAECNLQSYSASTKSLCTFFSLGSLSSSPSPFLSLQKKESLIYTYIERPCRRHHQQASWMFSLRTIRGCFTRTWVAWQEYSRSLIVILPSLPNAIAPDAIPVCMRKSCRLLLESHTMSSAPILHTTWQWTVVSGGHQWTLLRSSWSQQSWKTTQEAESRAGKPPAANGHLWRRSTLFPEMEIAMIDWM